MTRRETRRSPGGFVALGDRLRTRASARERFRLEVFLRGPSRRRRGVRPRSVLPRPPAPRANLEAFRDAHRVRLAVDVAVEEPSGHRPFALDPVDLRQRERGDGRLDATHRHEVRVRGGYRQVHVPATQKVQEGDHAVPRHAVEPAHLEMQNVGILRGGERASQDVALRPHVQVCDVDPIHGVARPTGPLPISTGPGCLRADLCRCRENTPRKWSPRNNNVGAWHVAVFPLPNVPIPKAKIRASSDSTRRHTHPRLAIVTLRGRADGEDVSRRLLRARRGACAVLPPLERVEPPPRRFGIRTKRALEASRRTRARLRVARVPFLVLDPEARGEEPRRLGRGLRQDPRGPDAPGPALGGQPARHLQLPELALGKHIRRGEGPARRRRRARGLLPRVPRQAALPPPGRPRRARAPARPRRGAFEVGGFQTRKRRRRGRGAHDAAAVGGVASMLAHERAVEAFWTRTSNEARTALEEGEARAPNRPGRSKAPKRSSS